MPKTTRPGRLAGQTRRLLRHPVSSLALGPRGWVQTANFAVTGVLCLAGAAGLHRTRDRPAGSRAGAVLVAAAGAGLIGSAAIRGMTQWLVLVSLRDLRGP